MIHLFINLGGCEQQGGDSHSRNEGEHRLYVIRGSGENHGTAIRQDTISTEGGDAAQGSIDQLSQRKSWVGAVGWRVLLLCGFL